MTLQKLKQLAEAGEANPQTILRLLEYVELLKKEVEAATMIDRYPGRSMITHMKRLEFEREHFKNEDRGQGK